jgi:hypothetical protein
VSYITEIINAFREETSIKFIAESQYFRTRGTSKGHRSPAEVATCPGSQKVRDRDNGNAQVPLRQPCHYSLPALHAALVIWCLSLAAKKTLLGPGLVLRG